MLYGFTVPRLKVANAVAFAATLIFNYVSSSRIISPYGIGTISRKYPTIITPASGAFAIWLFIYCLQFGFIIYQFYWPKETEAVLSREIGFFMSAHTYLTPFGSLYSPRNINCNVFFRLDHISSPIFYMYDLCAY